MRGSTPGLGMKKGDIQVGDMTPAADLMTFVTLLWLTPGMTINLLKGHPCVLENCKF